MCVCRGCYLLFTDSRAQLRYRAVPDRYLSFPEFALDRRAWEALQIPVGLAFFFRNSALDRTVAFYPDRPARPNPSWTCEAWDAISAADPRVGLLADDVEALLVRVREDEQPDCHLVPIDACYEFIGGLRMLWRGFDGGQEAREFIDAFFDQLAARSTESADDRRHRSGDRHWRSRSSTCPRTLRGCPDPDRAHQGHGARRRTGARHRAALPGPHRTVATRLLRRGSGGADSICSGRGNAGPPPNAPSCGSTAPRWCRRSSTPPRSTLPLECTYDFEVAAAKYLHALRDGTDAASIPVQRNRFRGGSTGLFRSAGVVGLRGPLRHAGAGVARADRRTTRTPDGCACLTTRSPRWPHTSRRAAC